MKTFFSICFFVVFTLFTSAQSFLSSTEKLAMSSLYSIHKEKIEDIRGNIDRERLLFYKNISWGSNTVATFDKLTSDSITFFT